MKLLALVASTVLLVLSLSACEGKMQKMTNQELAQKSSECVRNNPTSPGRVTACENIRKECEARRKEKIYAC
jgi:hypothetical protein